MNDDGTKVIYDANIHGCQEVVNAKKPVTKQKFSKTRL